MRLCSVAQCALTILYIKFKELSKLELSITIYINSMSHTRYIRIIAMMYACNSLPPWRAGIPRASFSSLQQPRHAAVEPVQQHHQDMLYILGKIAMKRLRLGWVSVFSWSCSCLHHCIRSLRLHCIHHFVNQLRGHQQTADISENIHVFGTISIAVRANAKMLLDRTRTFLSDWPGFHRIRILMNTWSTSLSFTASFSGGNQSDQLYNSMLWKQCVKL